MEARKFFLDTTTRSFAGSPQRSFSASVPSFFSEDVEQIELYFIKPSLSEVGTEYLDYSSNTVKLAVGLTGPAALQTSWTALSTAVTASVTSIVAGGGGHNEIQTLTFSGDRPVFGSLVLTLPARGVTVSSVTAGVFTAQSHGLLDGQFVTASGFTVTDASFTNSTYVIRDRTPNTFRVAESLDSPAAAAAINSEGGSVTIGAITTPPISAANLSAADLQASFQAAGIVFEGRPQILVSGDYASGFIVNFTNTQGNINFDNLVVTSSLSAPPGLRGSLSFNTNEIAQLIAAGNSGNLTMEVEVSDGSVRQTYTTGASVASDIIKSTSPIPAPVGDTISTLNFDDGSGGTWTVTVDSNGVLTATKQ